jgi:hypothetical protein
MIRTTGMDAGRGGGAGATGDGGAVRGVATAGGAGRSGTGVSQTRRTAARFAASGLLAVLLAMLVAALAGLAPALAADRLVVRNLCSFPVWIAQEGLPGTEAVVRLAPKARKSLDVAIGDAVILPTTVWPKAGCDRNGENCAIGERRSASVNSALEATWCSAEGCRSWFSLEFNGGYTLPVSVEPKAAENTVAGCSPAACPALTTNACPRSEDLSTGGAFPKLARQDLRMRDPKSRETIGCFSPCGKLTAPERLGGLGFSKSDRQAQAYCCTGAFAGSEACRAGPVDRTKYAKLVDRACDGEADAWAYDKAHGLHTCTGPVRLVYTVCPKG